MAASQDQISAFEKQLEKTLDSPGDSAKSDKKDAAVRLLRQKILEEIKRDRTDDPSTTETEEKYSADLRISTAELNSIFESLKQTHAQLFAENEIEDFAQFIFFIGLPQYESLKFTQSPEGIKLFGQDVDFQLPFNIGESDLVIYKQAIARIEARDDLREFITPGFKLTPRGGLRIEFTIRKNGKDIKYSATPDGVLRVDKESDPKDIREYYELCMLISKKREELRTTCSADGSLDKAQEATLMRIIYGNSESSTSIPLRYLPLTSEINRLIEASNLLKKICFVRTLYDEQADITVKEYGEPYAPSRFSYTYVDNRGIGCPIKKIDYENDRKSSYTEYFPSSDVPKKITKFSREGTPQEVNEYDKSGHVLKTSTFRADGTLESERVGNQENIYDEHGEQILYRMSSGTRVMVDSNGEDFATLDVTQKKHPEMSDDQYLDYLAANLNTPEKLAIFFELFMRYEYDDPSRNPNPQSTNAGPYASSISGKDYWQVATETIHRIENGKMLGDCDDYAFLAKEILKRQSKRPYVLGIPMHAVCIWFEQKPDGNWDAYSLCTFGLDKNGNLHGKLEDPEKAKGYPTLEEALNSLMPKYDESGVGLANGAGGYRIKNGEVEILDIPNTGERSYVDVDMDMLSDPKLIDRLLAANQLVGIGQYNDAISAYETMIAEDPKHCDFYHKNLANILFSIADKIDFADAVLISNALIAKYPDRPEYNALFGFFYGNRNDAEKAQEQFEIAIKKGSTDPQIYILYFSLRIDTGNNEDGIRILELALKRCPESDSQMETIYINLADSYITVGQPKKAIALYETAIPKYPNSSVLKIHYADIYKYVEPGHPEKLYEQYIADNPYDPAYNVAFAKFYKQAITDEITAHPNKYPEAFSNSSFDDRLINADFLKNHPDISTLQNKEFEQLENAIKNGGDWNCYTELISLYRKYERKDDILRVSKCLIEKYHSPNAEAYVLSINEIPLIDIYEFLIGIHPSNPDYHVFLGKLYEQDDPVKARSHYDLAIILGSTQLEPYSYVARIYRDNGNLDGYIKILESAINTVHISSIAKPFGILNGTYRALAEAYIEKGDKDKAIAMYEVAIDNGDRSSTGPLSYLYYTHENDPDKAIEMFLKFNDSPESKDPTSPEYQRELSQFYEMVMSNILVLEIDTYDLTPTPQFLSKHKDIARLHSKRIDALEKVCESDISKPNDFVSLAYLYSERGDIELALQVLLKAASGPGIDADAGRILLSQDKLDQKAFDIYLGYIDSLDGETRQVSIEYAISLFPEERDRIEKLMR
ncbi:MAG: tetratricopeptide repeat protein [Candidatus Gracilibacteria bacterium]